jgi:hypothetical protein
LIVQVDKSRRAVAGIVAGLIFFVMLFTIGSGYIVYNMVLTGQQNQAQANAQNNLANKGNEKLTFASQLISSNAHIGIVATNAGSVTSTLVALSIYDVTTNNLIQAPVNTGMTPSFPFALNPGRTSSVIDTGFAPPGSDTYTISITTNYGNGYIVLYPTRPLPTLSFSTTLSQQVVSPGYLPGVYDTAEISGVGSATNFKVTYYYFGNPQVPVGAGTPDGTCSTAPHLVGAVTVTGTTVPPSSPTYPPVSYPYAGSYSWDAILSDPSNNQVAVSPCEQLSVGTTGGSGGGTTAGIGSIVLDFNHFYGYLCTPATTPCATSQSSGYIQLLSNFNMIEFTTSLQNQDPCHRQLTLGTSYLVDVFASSPNSPKAMSWTVQSGIVFNYLDTRTIYWLSPSCSSGQCTSAPAGIYSVFLYLTGTTSGGLGGPNCPTGPFGQSIPFVTTTWS